MVYRLQPYSLYKAITTSGHNMIILPSKISLEDNNVQNTSICLR